MREKDHEIVKMQYDNCLPSKRGNILSGRESINFGRWMEGSSWNKFDQNRTLKINKMY